MRTERRPGAGEGLPKAAMATRARMIVVAATIVSSTALLGCTSPQERDERERAQLSKRIEEICALPPKERDAALERLKRESGLVLVCGDNAT